MGPGATANDCIQKFISSSVVVFTATEKVAHIDILLRFLLLGFLLGSGRSSATSATSGSGGGTRANIGEQLGDVLTLEGLSEEAGPVAFNRVSAGLDDLAEFLLLNIANNRTRDEYLGV